MAILRAMRHYLRREAVRRIGILLSLLVALRHDGNALMLCDRLIRAGVGMAVGVFVARKLGPSVFGEYSLALTYLSIAMPIAKAGLEHVVTRELSQHPDVSSAIVLAAVLIRSAAAVFSFVLGAAIYLLMNVDGHSPVFAFVFIALLFSPFEVCENLMLARGNVSTPTSIKLHAFLLSQLLRTLAVIADSGGVTLAIAVCAEYAIASFGYVLYAKAWKSELWPVELHLDNVRRLFRMGFVVLVSAICVMFYARADLLIMGQSLGSVQVGRYSAAIRLLDGFYIVPHALSAAIFPKLLDARRNDGDRERMFGELVKRYRITMSIYGVSVALGVLFFGQSSVVAIFGADYFIDDSVFYALSMAPLAYCISLSQGYLLIAAGKELVGLIRNVIAMIFAYIIGWYAIPILGEAGGGLALSGSLWVAVIVPGLWARANDMRSVMKV